MSKNILRIAIIVVIILLIPLLGNSFVDGWNWSGGDFVFAFIVLFCTGLAIDFSARKIEKPVVRVGVIALIVLALLVFWVEMATDGVSRALVSIFNL